MASGLLALTLTVALGCSSHTTPARALAALDDSEISPPVLTTDANGVVFAEFDALPTDAEASLRLMTQRHAVTSVSFTREGGIAGVRIQLAAGSLPPWQHAVLQELVLSTSGTVESWIEADPTADSCHLEASVDPQGGAHFWCSGGCSEEFPICTLESLVVPAPLPGAGKTRFFCLCKRAGTEPTTP